MPSRTYASSITRFLLVGISNTTIGLICIWATTRLLGADSITANLLGYAVGISVSFTLNRRWTFSFRGNGCSALLRFLLVFGFAYLANLLTVLGLIGLSGRDSFWFQIYGAAPYSVLLFLGCRWYAFPATAGAQVAISVVDRPNLP
jgi:putative flippase GtrA